MATPSFQRQAKSRLLRLAGPSYLRLTRRPAAGRHRIATYSRCQSTCSPAAGDTSPSSPVYTPPPRSDLTSRLASRRDRIQSAKPFSEFLTDSFHRQHDYLRISVTERCNLRCLYCMPEEGVQLSPPAHNLTTPEIVYLSSLFVAQGVTKIRLTGGEPTVRRDIVPLMQAIGDLRRDGLRELCLTTNGITLHRHVDAMVEAGLTGVNLSLDTLDPFQFQIMTRRNGFDAVMKTIDQILELNARRSAGIKLKINCVVMRGLNDREMVQFVEMTRHKPMEVRFIEYMPLTAISGVRARWCPSGRCSPRFAKPIPRWKRCRTTEMTRVKRTKFPALQAKSGSLRA